jgi:hypothetical protein
MATLRPVDNCGIESSRYPNFDKYSAPCGSPDEPHNRDINFIGNLVGLLDNSLHSGFNSTSFVADESYLPKPIQIQLPLVNV